MLKRLLLLLKKISKTQFVIRFLSSKLICSFTFQISSFDLEFDYMPGVSKLMK